MSEENKLSVEEAEAAQAEKIQVSLDNLKNKNSKFLFVIPESQSPAASVYEVYFHATTVKKMGFEVIMMTEKPDYEIPSWIEKDITNLTHMSMSDPNLKVGPEDIMVIPEVYSNIMEQTKNLPCMRVGLLQSVDYMTSALIPGTDWSAFGVNDVITTSESLREWLEVFYGEGKFNIDTYNIGIPDYFKRSDAPQKPVVSVIGRNANEISKFVKLFFSKYPQYSWVTFDTMVTKSKPPQPLRRTDFAKRLQGNFAALWIDRISSFGTFPLECMKSGTIPICLMPDIVPEYLIDRTAEDGSIEMVKDAGIWTHKYYDLPIMVAEALVKFLDDSIDPEQYDIMENIANKYNQADSEVRLTEIYENYVSKRITLLESALQPKEVVEE